MLSIGGIKKGGKNMAGQKINPNDYRKTLFGALLDARASHGGKTSIIEDMERSPLTYDRLLLGALILGQKISLKTQPREPVGILLPNVTGIAVTFFGLLAYGRVPAMLNFSSGLMNLRAACKAAEIKTVLSSRKFIKKAELEVLVDGLSEVVNIVWLEDIRQDIGLRAKLAGLLKARGARRFHSKLDIGEDDPGVILFTSGSEGVPKGVVLSHANIIANCQQVYRATTFHRSDRIFNPLPVFHSFGLTAGMLMPLLTGMKSFLYPSPLHYKTIPPLIGDFAATVLFGADTFLMGYARVAEPDQFKSLRFVIGGAERIKNRTRDLWREKFDLEIFEGYGATECAPVIAVNTPERNRAGTVGPFVHDMEHRLEPVEGLEEGGRLFVRGPNVMVGYYRAERPGVLEPTVEGWHDTGDIVTVDSDGFVALKGRAKRFAKIGGEMISLAAVEAYAASVWPENAHAVVGVEDKRKGEQLVLVTDCAEATREDIMAWAREHGVSELALPRRIVKIDALPLLGTGKIDYAHINRLALAPRTDAPLP